LEKTFLRIGVTMYLRGLCNVVPPGVMTQAGCFEALARTRAYADLQESSRILLKKVLLGASGIETRNFVSTDLDRLSALGAEDLHGCYERGAVDLGTGALAGAVGRSGLAVGELDALVVCSCTGYLCPGLSSHLAGRLGLRPDVHLVDLVGQGCGAALPMLRQARALLADGFRNVACVAVEVSSAAFYLDDDAGVLISLCLFGDGASGSVWSAQPPMEGRRVRVDAFQTLHWPGNREELRFANAGGKLKNILHRSVPATAARAVGELSHQAGFVPTAVLAHPGGKQVLAALRGVLPGHDLAESGEVLRRHGNMSSPSVLFVLEEWLRQPRSTGPAWMVSFGAGFTCHACRVELG
jgi:alkylresorcinol/alkylpyrone synthase